MRGDGIWRSRSIIDVSYRTRPDQTRHLPRRINGLSSLINDQATLGERVNEESLLLDDPASIVRPSKEIPCSSMPDSYQLPAIVLTALLLPAFAQLYLRSRDTRTLLWFLGFFFAVLRMLQFYDLACGPFLTPASTPGCRRRPDRYPHQFGSFSGLLVAATFRVGRITILYAIPFIIPLIAYALLHLRRLPRHTPSGMQFLIFPALGGLSLFAGCAWAISHREHAHGHHAFGFASSLAAPVCGFVFDRAALAAGLCRVRPSRHHRNTRFF